MQGVAVHFHKDGESVIIKGTHLLVATGRKPNLKQLSLDRAGIAHDENGIKVNEQLKTSNRRVYAIGDSIGGQQFTHLANYHAGIVIKNALFRLKPDVSAVHIPRVTYTDPELAQIGLTEQEAHQKYRRIRIFRRRREFVFRREPIIRRHDNTLGEIGQRATGCVHRIDGADHPTAAMKVNKHREWSATVRRVDTHRQLSAWATKRTILYLADRFRLSHGGAHRQNRLPSFLRS